MRERLSSIVGVGILCLTCLLVACTKQDRTANEAQRLDKPKVSTPV